MHPLEVSPLSKADFSNSVSMRAKNIAYVAVLIVKSLKLQYNWLSLDMFWLLRLYLGFNIEF